MIAGTLDVLVVGAPGLAEVEDLRAAGLAVERVDSLVSAVERLRVDRPALVLAGGELCDGREADAFGSLREAGAGAVLVVYPPRLAWRTSRALAAGADAGLALPAEPGAVLAQALRLLRRGADAHPFAAPGAATGALDRGESPLEALVGDIAVINRSVGDLERLLEEVVRVFARRAAASRCSLMLVDEARNELFVRKSVGLPDDLPATPVPVGRGFAGHVAKTGVPMLVADVERLRRTTLPALSTSRGTYRTSSCLILPLRGSRGVLGVVCLADKESGAPFDEFDHGALRFLADQAAQAVENALQFRQMQDLAAIDELTGLSNRRQFQYALEREIQRARRYDRQLTLALFDVDHFKKYNDSCGHQAGDRALATIGEILRTSLREVDIVARYGGEEFAVILPETAAKPGAGVSPFPFLERLRMRVETAVFPGEEKQPGGRLTLSGGIACFPDDAETVKDLIGEADRALYVSKARGRNTITYRGSTVTE